MNPTKNKIAVKCDFCGAEIWKYPSTIRKHNFCSRACLASFSSKTKNPLGYAALKNYAGMSQNMKRLNAVLNPNRMTPAVRLKLRKARLLTPAERKSYPKLFGRHLHRIVAELSIGRELKRGEVVHHIDGNKQNNDPENLMVFSSQAEHAAWHAEHNKKKEGGAI